MANRDYRLHTRSNMSQVAINVANIGHRRLAVGELKVDGFHVWSIAGASIVSHK